MALKVFATNLKFSQADIVVIRNDALAHIDPIKTLIRLHNLKS